MAIQVYTWRGAVEPAETSPSGNQVAIYRGAVEPAASSAVLVGYDGVLKDPRDSMPLDHSSYHAFIASTGITTTGDLQTDYRRALCSAAGIADENSVSIQDAFKKYIESL